MIERLIDRNLKFLKKHIVCDDDTVEVYRYSLRIIYSYIMDVLVLMSLAIVFNKVIETIIMLFTFAVLQVYGGGYHAKTQLGCMAIMVVGWFVGVFGLQKVVTLHWCVGLIIMIMFAFLIFSIAPIINEKHPVNSDIYVKSKKNVRIVVVLVGIIAVTSIIVGCWSLYYIISITVTLYSMSLIAASLKQYQATRY